MECITLLASFKSIILGISKACLSLKTRMLNSSTFLSATVESRGSALSSSQKMKIVLRYVADPDTKVVSVKIGVDQSTLLRIVISVVERVIAKLTICLNFLNLKFELKEEKTCGKANTSVQLQLQ